MKAVQTNASNIKNILKPWTKEQLKKCWDWCSPMLDGESLTKLYKCMGSFCSFSTNDTRSMRVHLEKHDDRGGIFTCPYCVLDCDGISLLIDHIQKNHGQCRFQCGYCFYRSLDAANVLNHQQIYHVEDRCGEKSIIELAEHPEIPRAHYMSAALKGKIRQKILKCTVCHQQYLAISAFIEHLQTAHDGVAITCCWCLKTVKKDNVAPHLLTHYIGTYECLYCDYACNIKQMMQRHLSNVHSNKPLFCSKRREAINSTQPNKKYLLDLRVEVPNVYVKTLNPETSKLVTKTSVNNNDASPTAEHIGTGDKKNECLSSHTKTPKILNVQGGIQLSNEGKIITAKETLPEWAGKRIVYYPSGITSDPRALKRAGDLTPAGTKKRFKMIRSQTGKMMLKLSMGTNIPVPNPSTNPAHSATSHFLDSKEPVRSVPKQPLIMTTSTERPIRYSAMSCKTNSSANSSLDEPTSSQPLRRIIRKSFENSIMETNIAPDGTTKNVFGERETPVKEIGFHFEEFAEQIDRYYRFLCIRTNKTKITPMEINVCGIISCSQTFENHDALVQHMRNYHEIQSTETLIPITCSHCLMQLSNINTYIYHLTVHSLNQYVCFVCCYKHFLLPSVAKHMNTAHGCTSVRLSYAHPVKRDLLSDIITVMPGTISIEEKQRYIKETIDIGEKLLRKSSNTKKSSEWSNSSFSGITATSKVSHKRYPKQAHYTLLYKCGLCDSNEKSRISFQKHLLVCPARKENSCYVCAHCSKMFRDWMKKPELIFEHLYYHGENLYGCGNCAYYHYLFENVAMHIKSVMHSTKCEINVLRESSEQWECNVCQLRSPLRQTIMEHMQNMHDLPGERFMCSICKFRTFTNAESVNHFKESHDGQDVVMIEMYHVKEIDNSSRNEETESDSSDDLEIIEKDIDEITISSSLDDGENVDQRMTDFDDNERQITELRRVGKAAKTRENSTLCPVLREHSYSLIDIDEQDQQAAVLASVKVEKGLETDSTSTNAADGNAKNASENTANEINQPSAESTTAAIDVNCSSETSQTLTDNENEETCSSSTASIMEQSTSTNGSMNVSMTERRASKRVAVKKDVTCRWSVSTKFGCLFCDDCFVHYKSLYMHSRNVHGLQSKEFLNDSMIESNGSFTGFRLCSIKRCFYCDKEDTFSHMRTHCVMKHAEKTFVCLDYWNPLKCGLCVYLNGSGDEKEFANHFQQHHNTVSKHLSLFDRIDDAFIDWALKLGKKQIVEFDGDGQIIRYICGLCTEQTKDELSMGQHVAKHSVEYDCPKCEASFKELKVLYDHVTILHGEEEFAVPSNVPIADQTLLEVKMCFINGFILTKREAQYTKHGSIQTLEEGYQKYYTQQISDLELHKKLLMTPVLDCAEDENNLTCKTLMQNQNKYPVIKITPVEANELEEDP